jgi:hypothetical protein
MIVLANKTSVSYTGYARASKGALYGEKLAKISILGRLWSLLTTPKERSRVLEENPRHGKTWVIPFRRLLPQVAEDRWHLGIFAAIG